MPPCKGEYGELTMTQRLQPLQRLPPRAGKVARTRKGKALGAASPGTGEASIRELQPDEDDATVKPARTISGGGANGADDWMGVWGKQRFPQWRRSFSSDDCFKGQLVVPSSFKERSLLLSVRLESP